MPEDEEETTDVEDAERDGKLAGGGEMGVGKPVEDSLAIAPVFTLPAATPPSPEPPPGPLPTVPGKAPVRLRSFASLILEM